MISQLGSYKASVFLKDAKAMYRRHDAKPTLFCCLFGTYDAQKKKMRFERAPKQEGRQIRRPFAASVLVLLTINAAGWFAPLFGAIYVAAAELRRTSRHQPYFSLLRWFDAVLSQKQALLLHDATSSLQSLRMMFLFGPFWVSVIIAAIHSLVFTKETGNTTTTTTHYYMSSRQERTVTECFSLKLVLLHVVCEEYLLVVASHTDWPRTETWLLMT